MAQRSNQLNTRCGDDLFERVERYREREGYESRSQAVHDLLEAGIREQETVFGAPLKRAAIEVGVLFVATGVAVAVTGAATAALGLFLALQIATVLVLLGGATVASAELVRLLAGRNAVGAALRRWVA